MLATIFPVDAALDLAFKIGWVLRGLEGHLDVHVGVGLQLSEHGLKLEIIAAIFKFYETLMTYHISPDF